MVSSSVTSAWSCWVTWGITAQASASCSALRRRIPRSGSRSTAPHCSNRGSGGRATGPARGRGASAGPLAPPARRSSAAAGPAAPGHRSTARPRRGERPRPRSGRRARSGDARQVHAHLARQPPGRRGRRRRRAPAAGAGGAGGRRRGRGRHARAPRRPEPRPAALSAVAEAQQDRADLDALAGLDVHGGHASAERRGQLDLGLLGLHQEDGLVLLDLVALRDEDADDLRLGEAFPEVGQLEFFRHRGAAARRAPPPRRRASPGRRAARGPVPGSHPRSRAKPG